MANTIEDLLPRQPERSYTFAVGAFHYLGPDSVIQILEERGFRITRVTKDWPWTLLSDQGNG